MRFSILFLCLFLSAGAAAAPLTYAHRQFVEARWEDNGGPIDPLSRTDSGIGAAATAGVNLTSGTCYSPSCVIASGFQAGDGRAYLGMELGWADSLDQTSRVRLDAQRRVTVLNNGAAPLSLEFEYTLKDMMINLSAGSGGPTRDSNPLLGPSEAVGVQIGYQVLVNSVEARRHTFTLWGGFNAPEDNVFFDWQSEGGLAPALLTPTDCIFGKCGGRMASFGEFTGSLSLGSFGIGEEKDVETRMWIEAVGNLIQEWGAQARFGDPNGIPATAFRITSGDPVGVPVASSLHLLPAGLCALLLMHRRGAPA